MVSFAVSYIDIANVHIIDSGARRILCCQLTCMEDHQPTVAEAVLCKWGGAVRGWAKGEPQI